MRTLWLVLVPLLGLAACGPPGSGKAGTSTRSLSGFTVTLPAVTELDSCGFGSFHAGPLSTGDLLVTSCGSPSANVRESPARSAFTVGATRFNPT